MTVLEITAVSNITSRSIPLYFTLTDVSAGEFHGLGAVRERLTDVSAGELHGLGAVRERLTDVSAGELHSLGAVRERDLPMCLRVSSTAWVRLTLDRSPRQNRSALLGSVKPSTVREGCDAWNVSPTRVLSS